MLERVLTESFKAKALAAAQAAPELHNCMPSFTIFEHPWSAVAYHGANLGQAPGVGLGAFTPQD